MILFRLLWRRLGWTGSCSSGAMTNFHPPRPETQTDQLLVRKGDDQPTQQEDIVPKSTLFQYDDKATLERLLSLMTKSKKLPICSAHGLNNTLGNMIL